MNLKSYVYALVAFFLIFSAKIPLVLLAMSSPGRAGTASIYLADVGVLLIVVYYLYTAAKHGSWDLRLTVPKTLALMTAVVAYVLFGVLLATVRAEQSVIMSYLWTLKLFEAFFLLLFAQHHADEDVKRAVVAVILTSGVALSVLAIAGSLGGNTRFRAELIPGTFYNNPNIIASFLVLAVLLHVTILLKQSSLSRITVYGLGTFLCLAGTVTTGSRSGMVALIAGLSVLMVVYRDRILGRTGLYGGAVLLAGVPLLPSVVNASSVNRLFVWLTFENGIPQIAEGSNSFAARIRLTIKGFELFADKPLFGYGWVAVPYRVGILDTLYMTLLVDLGLVGIVLMSVFYAQLVRVFLKGGRYGNPTGYAGAAWICALIAQGVGGTFLRIPQIFMLALLLVAVSYPTTQANIAPAG